MPRPPQGRSQHASPSLVWLHCPPQKQQVSRPATLPRGKFCERLDSESQYLKGTDIKSPFDAIISGMEKVDFDNGAKWVLDLEDQEKSIVLNKINGASLAADLGDDMDLWIGQRIHVFTERRRNPQTGQMVPAVAVRRAAEDLEDEPDDFPDDEDDELE